MPFPTANLTTPVSLLQYVNESLTNQIFGIMLLVSIFMIILISLSRFELSKALITSLFITTVSSIFTAFLGLTSPDFIFPMIALLAVSIFVSYR